MPLTSIEPSRGRMIPFQLKNARQTCVALWWAVEIRHISKSYGRAIIAQYYMDIPEKGIDEFIEIYKKEF
jgi:hypothetical protein